ncbi:MAG: TIR domain-containing protein [Thiolinea sp.]
MTKVFISYSHDSDEHRDFVRGIVERLRQQGLDCQLDQYVNGFPPEGWPLWMENQIEAGGFCAAHVYARLSEALSWRRTGRRQGA